jgi:aromatic-amino-acid transaminase
VSAFNRAAEGSALRYPRYDGGFFVTLFAEDAKGSAERLKARGVFTVPGKDSLRVALCSVPEAQVPALVDALRDCVR